MRKHAYTWVTLGLFLISLAGHWFLGWRAYLEDARAHGQPPEVRAYLIQAGRDTLENWQSEFLQLVWQVAGLALLWHVGSPQSREGHDRLEEKVDFLMARVEGGPAKRRELDKKFPRT